MPEHYFSENPHSKSSPKKWKFNLKGKEYSFDSDAGVFSKNTVDFGSQLLIETFTLPKAEGDLLDLGCGYGPVGISLAKENTDWHIVMSDVNARAVDLAAKNSVNNAVANVDIIQSDSFENLADREFAAILLNPPIRAGKKLIYEMFENAADSLIAGGDFWIVIQKKQGAPSAKEKMEQLFGNAELMAKDKGYQILRSTKV